MKNGPFFQIFLFVNILKVITDSQEIVKIVERGPLYLSLVHPSVTSSITIVHDKTQKIDIV